jgi:lipopolysaccharide heptosyltransferase II
MRKVDRYIGIPLCFMLTLVHKFIKIFKKSASLELPENVLFIEMSEMGSIILAYSLFKKTQQLYPEAQLHFLTFEESRYAVDILDIIPPNNVFTIDNRNFLIFTISAFKTILKLRRLKLDMAIDLESFSRFSAILSYLSGAKERVGYYRFNQEGLYRGKFLTHEVPFNPHIHIAQNMLNLIYATSSSFKSTSPPAKRIPDKNDIQIPKFKPPQDAEDKIQKELSTEIPFLEKHHKIILINPNASDIVPLRRWPTEHYIQLIHLILKNPQTIILITGKSSEKDEADRIIREVNSDRCLNLAGKTSFPELITLYQMADILITNDSGPVHFSAMTDIRTFVFFGPETPDIFGPLGEKAHVFYKGMACSPCVSAFNQKHSPCRDNQCLKMISPHEVYEKVAPYL